MKKRIWELDAARGLALLGMLIVHFIYDLTELTGLISWQEPGWFLLIKNHCGFVFLVISGVCVTLGRHSVRRGCQVLACGLLCSAVTAGMYRLGLADESIIIYFGVLHCLGVCMLLWGVLRRLRGPRLAALGLILIAAGLVVGRYAFDVPLGLIPLGLCPEWFVSSDYFPLLPNLGFFLLGAALGLRVYAGGQSRFPRGERYFRPLCALGRRSLWVYLLHQPILAGLAMGLKALVS